MNDFGQGLENPEENNTWENSLHKAHEKYSKERELVLGTLLDLKPTLVDIASNKFPSGETQPPIRITAMIANRIEEQTEEEIDFLPDVLYYIGKPSKVDVFYEKIQNIKDEITFEKFHSVLSGLKSIIIEELGYTNENDIPKELITDMQKLLWDEYIKNAQGETVGFFGKKAKIKWLSTEDTINKDVSSNDAFISVGLPGHVGHLIHLPARQLAETQSKEKLISQLYQHFQKTTFTKDVMGS